MPNSEPKRFLPLSPRKQQLSNKAKTFQCPSCCSKYDFHFRNDILTGRVPLILHCKHTLCEGCIRTASRQKQVTCPKCSAVSTLEKSDLKLQELFPVNFYILGLIYYSRPAPGDHVMYDFKPSGFRFSTTPKVQILEDMEEMGGFEFVKQETCSGSECNRPAELECEACAAHYCAACCDKLHKMVRNFRNHKISPLTRNVVKEISHTCPSHVGAILEYHCIDCSIDVCCHCFIQQHTGHKYYLVTELKEENRAQFLDLVVGAEEMLKRLEQTQKTINHRLKQLMPSRSTSTVVTEAEIKLSEGFANLHAQLQVAEEKLRASVVTAVHGSYYKLTEVATELENDVRALNGLLDLARTIVNGGGGQKKINVQMVLEKLKNVADLPCCLIGKQTIEGGVSVTFSDALENLEQYITISNSNTNEYSLVPKGSVPQGYEELQPLNDDITTCSTPTNLSRDLSSVTSVAYSSDSDASSSVDAKVSSSSSTDINKWLQNVRSEKLKKAPSQRLAATSDVNFENVKVVHLYSPSSFYVQLLRSNQQLEQITEELKGHVKNLAAYVHEPIINEIYAVKHEVKPNKYRWCRGRLTEIIVREPASENLYGVFYLDYGNTQNVKKAQLRKLVPELMAIPPLAVHCSLYNILPKNQVWSQQADKLMIQIIDRNSVVMYVQERLPQVWNVDLVAFSPGVESTSVRDALLFTGYGVLRDCDNEFNAPVQTINSETVQLIKNGNILKENESFDVIISYIKDPDNIYIQKASNKKHINDLEEAMEKFYKNNKKCRIFNPKKGMAVVVQCEGCLDNLTWCRGEIANVIKGEGLVEVFLVDYGHTVSVSWGELRKIQHQFIRLECQAILVKLADVEPLDAEVGWTANCKSHLDAYVQDKQNFKIIVSQQTDRSHVALFEFSRDVDICVNAVLVESGLAVSTGKLSKTVKWLKDNDKTNTQEGFTRNLLKTIQSATEQIEDEQNDEDDEFKNVIRKEVTVIKAISPDEIYIQFKDVNIRNRFVEMDRNLQEFYTANKPKLETFEVNDRCVVYQKNTDRFYRASIVKKTDTKITVQLYDTPEQIDVDSSDIYTLDDQFRIYPPATFKCYLDRIVAAGDSQKWSFMAVEYLQELFKNNHQILMTKSSSGDPKKTDFWPVIMWYVELICNGPLEPTQRKLVCINKALTTNGLALKKRQKQQQQQQKHRENNEDVNNTSVVASDATLPIAIPETLIEFTPAPPIAKRKFSGIVTYVDDYGIIYLQDYDLQAPFEEMVMQMNAYFNKTEPETNPFEPGEWCTVLYRDNKYWYRGKVVTRDEDGNYKVYMIDYGNIETCKHEELRKTLMYLDVPSFSQKVKLHNVYSRERKWLTSDVDELQTLLNNEKVVVLVRKKQTKHNPTLVDIYLENRRLVNDLIVQRSTNLSKEPFKTPPPTIAIDSDADDVIIEDVIEEFVKPKIYTFDELPPAGIKLEVGIINVLNYNDIIFEITNSTENENFITMSATMQNDGDKQPNLRVIKVGQPCIAKYSEDQLWYRAQIMEMLTSDVVKVWFVDFGNFEDTKITDLREIKSEWLNYPVQHYKAEICGIKLRDETRAKEVVDFLLDLCGTVQTIRIVETDPLKIEMFKSNSEDEELLYWDLIENGILAL